MNKIKVGNANSPNLKKIQSKVGSLANASHRPGGGEFKIKSQKLEWKAAPRTDALNDKYVPHVNNLESNLFVDSKRNEPKVNPLITSIENMLETNT